MTHSLRVHEKGYHLSCLQVLASVIHSPYAKRHYQLAQSNPTRWCGHMILTGFHSTPILSLFSTAIEYIVANCGVEDTNIQAFDLENQRPASPRIERLPPDVLPARAQIVVDVAGNVISPLSSTRSPPADIGSPVRTSMSRMSLGGTESDLKEKLPGLSPHASSSKLFSPRHEEPQAAISREPTVLVDVEPGLDLPLQQINLLPPTPPPTPPVSPTYNQDAEAELKLDASFDMQVRVLKNHTHALTYGSRELTRPQAMEKARKNAVKVLRRFQLVNDAQLKDRKYIPRSLLAPETTIPSLEHLLSAKREKPWILASAVTSTQSGLHYMEDTYIYREPVLGGVLYAVFDGHGTDLVSKFLKNHFAEYFDTALKANPGNPFRAFEVAIHEIQKAVVAKKMKGGSTLTACYFEDSTGLMYTCNVGDSEARIVYGTEKSKQKKVWHLPCSGVKNWTDPKEEGRYYNNLVEYGKQQKLTQDVTGKLFLLWQAGSVAKRRFPGFRINGEEVLINQGINVPRTIGDIDFLGSKTAPGIIQKPKITAVPVGVDFTVIIATDGLWNNINLKALDLIVPNHRTPTKLAGKLQQYAYSVQDLEHTYDNITIIAINVTEGRAQAEKKAAKAETKAETKAE